MKLLSETQDIILCKLTSQNLQTHGGFTWVVGEWARELPEGGRLCTDEFYHCYEHPLLAVLLNPIHAHIRNPRLWLIEAKGAPVTDHGLKRGYKTMRLMEEIELPSFTMEQHVEFGVRCALEVYDSPQFRGWAENWLSGKDRSAEAAAAAEAEWAAWAEAALAAHIAHAARAAMNAALAAVDAATAEAEAAWAAWADAAARAAMNAAHAAVDAATKADHELQLIRIAKEVVSGRIVTP